MSQSGLPSAEALVSRIIDQGSVSFQQVLVVCLCMFFNVLDGFDITAMAIVANPVSAELGLTPERMGWIFSFALAGMMAGAMFLAPVSDVIGRRRLIIISLCLIGGSILLTAQADSFLEFAVLRFISGAGAGAMLASQATLAAEYSSEKFRTLSVAAVTAGYPLGAMFTSVFADLIIPDYGWRGMFWFGGALTLSMGLVAFLFIPESLKYLIERRPPNALAATNQILKKLNKPELTELPAAGTSAPSGLIKNMSSLLAPGQRKVTLVLWLIFFLCFSSLYFFMSWLPALMEQTGYGVAAGRRAFFLFNLGGFIGVLFLGIAATQQKLTDVISLLLLGAAVTMAVFALVPLALGVRQWMIFLIGVLLQGGFTGMYGAAAKAYPTRIRSTGIGWSIGLGRFGAVIGPLAAGYLIGSGFGLTANFLIFAIPVALGGVIAYTLHIR